jgi:hypothetical protein
MTYNTNANRSAACCRALDTIIGLMKEYTVVNKQISLTKNVTYPKFLSKNIAEALLAPNKLSQVIDSYGIRQSRTAGMYTNKE